MKLTQFMKRLMKETNLQYRVGRPANPMGYPNKKEDDYKIEKVLKDVG